MLYGAIEAGGTKMVLAVGNEHGSILDRIEIKTEEPEVTISRMRKFFSGYKIGALGIGAFGPVNVNAKSPYYGTIGRTPKVNWRNVSWIKEMDQGGGIPILIDTDVNVACLGEVKYGNARGIDNALYLTIGTGIGAGIWSEGRLLHGMLHPEAGHIGIKRRKDDLYPGCCPYHDQCFEGLASGPALKERYQKDPAEINRDSIAWELEADYIAQAIRDYILCYSPQKIILGGGVMKQEQLFRMVRQKTAEYLNQYIYTKELKNMEEYIVPASLKGTQGIKGALYMAIEAYNDRRGNENE